MTQNELELIHIIRNAKDPTKAMETAIDMMVRCAAGESIESIAASYGFTITDTGCFERA